MSSLQTLTRISDNTLFIDLIGHIDEDADLSKIAITTKKVVINFDRVSFINSCGIRTWILFIEKIPTTTELVYSHCPKIIIDQINMVKGFIPENATLVDFYAPYYCENCDEEEHILLKCNEIINFTPPIKKCKKCQRPQEFDALSSQYFSFLQAR